MEKPFSHGWMCQCPGEFAIEMWWDFTVAVMLTYFYVFGSTSIRFLGKYLFTSLETVYKLCQIVTVVDYRQRKKGERGKDFKHTVHYKFLERSTIPTWWLWKVSERVQGLWKDNVGSWQSLSQNFQASFNTAPILHFWCCEIWSTENGLMELW